jgi:hypothetical protein
MTKLNSYERLAVSLRVKTEAYSLRSFAKVFRETGSYL